MTEPNRDRWGRYILTHPDTGEEQPWTRATTLAEALEDQFGIKKWAMRGTAVGIGMRPDLLALAQSLDMDTDKQALDKLCDSALEAAKASARSNLGTALHKMTERIDRGEDFQVPFGQQAEIAAYKALKERYRIETRPDYIERITVVPELGVAGTSDRIVRRDGKVYIGDLKTGEKLDYSWGKIAVQLAIYSRGRGLWDEANGTWGPMPEVDQQWGIVLHVPAGSPARAEAYWVDLAAGWEAAQICYWVRENWRKRKDLYRKVN